MTELEQVTFGALMVGFLLLTGLLLLRVAQLRRARDRYDDLAWGHLARSYGYRRSPMPSLADLNIDTSRLTGSNIGEYYVGPVLYSLRAKMEMAMSGVSPECVETVLTQPARDAGRSAGYEVRLERDFGSHSLLVWALMPWPPLGPPYVQSVEWIRLKT